ncbi:hypothetical protein [Anaeromicrobium sediminis]|uniref:Uncharacterized protein n=1 Tax=Anaeromicrobium sediminis TaxID=1478221 RepID=A0A267MNS7_9FIRM|nr:hypothetical protein [Anaeromicrobium sediminis]PAB61077.1 hypothetical protein CCE28_01220 [Anaeromicrobium sediminis]
MEERVYEINKKFDYRKVLIGIGVCSFIIILFKIDYDDKLPLIIMLLGIVSNVINYHVKEIVITDKYIGLKSKSTSVLSTIYWENIKRIEIDEIIDIRRLVYKRPVITIYYKGLVGDEYESFEESYSLYGMLDLKEFVIKIKDYCEHKRVCLDIYIDLD